MNPTNLFISGLLTLLLIGSGCTGTRTNDAGASEYTDKTLEAFFPEISGNLGDYSIQIPAGYESYALPTQSIYGAMLWSAPEDLELFLDPDNYDASLHTNSVFKAVWSINVGGVGDQIVQAGIPLTKADLEKDGTEVSTFTSGLFHGLTGVPALAMTGTLQGQQVYLAYIYSPANDTVMLVVLGGNKTGDTDEQDWNAFVNSLEIQ